MKNKIKFHLICFVLNAVIVTILMNIHAYIIENFIDRHAFFARMGEYFHSIYLCSIFIFSWLFSFAIYKFEIKKHFKVFILSLLSILLLYTIIIILDNWDENIDRNGNALNYLYRSFYYVLFKEQTLIASFLITIVIYLNQMIIGKKLLPALYKNPEKLDCR